MSKTGFYGLCGLFAGHILCFLNLGRSENLSFRFFPVVYLFFQQYDIDSRFVYGTGLLFSNCYLLLYVLNGWNMKSKYWILHSDGANKHLYSNSCVSFF